MLWIYCKIFSSCFFSIENNHTPPATLIQSKHRVVFAQATERTHLSEGVFKSCVEQRATKVETEKFRVWVFYSSAINIHIHTKTHLRQTQTHTHTHTLTLTQLQIGVTNNPEDVLLLRARLNIIFPISLQTCTCHSLLKDESID